MKLVYPAIFRAKKNEKEGYDVVFPDLENCITEGINIAEAISNATETACAWALKELQQGNTVPNATCRQSIKCSKKEFVNLIVLDIDAYAEKHGNKAVRKNLTIPAWLNTFAEKKHFNCSWILQTELIKLWKIAQSQSNKTNE